MKSTILKLTTGLALAGGLFLAQADTSQVSAAEWQARPVEQIAQDIENTNGAYTVTSGDTLSSISKAAGVDLEVLAQVNGIQNIHLIFPGQSIDFKYSESTGKVDEVVLEENTYEVPESAQIEETVQEPVQEETAQETVQEEAVQEPDQEEVVQEPAQEVVQEPVQEQPQAQNDTQGQSPHATYNSNPTTSGAEYDAKEWIAQRESNGSYTAVNGQYWGRYQLNPTLVEHGAGPAAQEAAADRYVADRYGSWVQAKQFWQANGWY